MAKRLQQDSGEERVTAKSRPMMSFIARVPSHVSSSTSESLVKRSYGNKNPWSAKDERTRQLVVGSDQKTASDYCHEQSIESSFSARYSKWDDNQAWSSQGWKANTSMCDRATRCDLLEKTRESQPGFFREKTQHDGTAQSIVNEAYS